MTTENVSELFGSLSTACEEKWTNERSNKPEQLWALRKSKYRKQPQRDPAYNYSTGMEDLNIYTYIHMLGKLMRLQNVQALAYN